MPEWLNVADEEAVELITGEPRGSSRRANQDYIALEDLDEDGQGPSKKTSIFFDHGTLNKLIFLPFTLAIVAVLFIGYSLGRPPSSYTRITNGTHEFYPTTIVISFDGLHPHYISSERTPNLDHFIRSSGAVPYMTPSFPTQTFPNHWTLVTGLYPGNHGIIGNNFYDPVLGEFKNTEYEKLSQKFWGGEPIWKTASRQGRISAVHMWPGLFPGDAQYTSEFNKSEPLGEKLNQILEWLDLEIDERPQLVMGYVPNIDVVGHEYGVTGEELTNELEKVDEFVAHLQQGLDRRNLNDIVNIIFVSDHGMAPTSDDRVLFLDDYIDEELIERTTAWPNVGIKLKDPYTADQIRLNLTRSIPKHMASVFDSSGFPPEWHFGSEMTFGERIAPIYIVPSPGWSITTHSKYNGTYGLKGLHGYAPESPLMRAFFAASGPKFNAGKYEPFPNVNFYPLLCKLLNIKATKNDGVAEFEAFNSTNYQEDYPGVPFDMVYFENSTFTEF